MAMPPNSSLPAAHLSLAVRVIMKKWSARFHVANASPSTRQTILSVQAYLLARTELLPSFVISFRQSTIAAAAASCISGSLLFRVE